MIKQAVANARIKGYMKFRWMLRRPSNEVLFMSFNGLQYSDNPKAISIKLHELYPQYRIVWAVRDKEKMRKIMPQYIKLVNCYGKEFYDALASCFCFVTNTHNRSYINKRDKGQFYIQTWHGDIGLKKVLYDVTPKEKWVKPIMDEYITDLCIAASDYGESQYRTAFAYKGEVLRVGTPRNDKLVCANSYEEAATRAQLGIDEDTKILIYAPTFRDSSRDSQDVQVNLHEVMKILESEGGRWVCLVRSHSNTGKLNFCCDGKTYIDASTYPDMADLLAIGDLLITDYSSCATDFIRRGKGAILAAFDLEAYIHNDREIPFNFEEKGFIVAKTQQELETILAEMDDTDYRKSAERVCRAFHVYESGRSAQIICDRINDFYLTNHGKQRFKKEFNLET